MDGNSHEPGTNPVSPGFALVALRNWLRQEGGSQKIPAVLDLLAGKTQAALERGDSPPAVDPDTLRDLFENEHGSTGNELARRWLPSRNMANWWTQRTRQIAQVCRAAGADCVPTLEISQGGGRGNPTTYRLLFELDEGTNADTVDADPIAPATVRYSIEPAKAALWLRLVIGHQPFRMRSWRGYLLMLATGVPVLVWVLLLIVLFPLLSAPRVVTTLDLLLGLMMAALGWTIFRSFRPIFRLPDERVTIAGDPYLAFNQLHGQFRLSRDAHSKKLGGWFSLVRHSGNCPVCSGVVELANGGEAFPGRVVGRCSDSPLEHVYSFDPVSLEGRLLR